MNQFVLLAKRRFAPFFATQALGAFNDNAFRYAMIGMATFRMGLSEGALATYTNVALALFIAPFFLFSASAGQLAERMEKTRLIRMVKLLEIGAMSVAALGFWLHSLGLLLVVLALMGLHSTIFGPIKYAILPQALRPPELVGGNGLVESGTSLSILMGSIAGNALMAVPRYGPTLASLLVLAVAVTGYAVSRAIPPAPATAPELRFNPNPLSETWRVLRHTCSDHTVLHAVLGISWFWFFGAVMTAQLPLYTRNDLGGDASVLTLALTLFSVGVGIGSLLCERLSARRVEPGLVPLGALGLTGFGIDLYLARPHAAAVRGQDWLAFLGSAGGVHLALDLTAIGLAAGLYIVPLFALVQSRTAPSHLSRVIAGTNIINALFMVAAAGFGIALLRAGFSVPQVFLAAAVLNLLVMAYIAWQVPEFARRFAGWVLLRLGWRVHVDDTGQVPAEGPVLLRCAGADTVTRWLLPFALQRPVLVLSAPSDGRSLPAAAAAVLRRSGAVCLFHEGGVSPLAAHGLPTTEDGAATALLTLEARRDGRVLHARVSRAAPAASAAGV